MPLFEHGNYVGQGLEKAKSALVAQAQSLAKSLIFGATVPLWVGTVIAFVVGLFTALLSGGEAVGAVLVPTVLGTSAALVVAVVRASAMAGPKLGEAATSIWDAPNKIGVRAQQLFEVELAPQLARLGDPSLHRAPVVGELRAAGKSIVFVAGAFLVAAVAVFVIGVGMGVCDYLNPEPVCTYSPVWQRTVCQ